MIRWFFDIQVADKDPVEPVGTDDPVPLLDMWAGLKLHLSSEHEDLLLVRCDGFSNTGRVLDENELECLIKGDSIYIARKDSESDELMAVLEELGLQLSGEQVEAILGRTAPPDVRALREEVRKCSTDEERLLVAVGEVNLMSRLPASLIAIMEADSGPAFGNSNGASRNFNVPHRRSQGVPTCLDPLESSQTVDRRTSNRCVRPVVGIRRGVGGRKGQETRPVPGGGRSQGSSSSP